MRFITNPPREIRGFFCSILAKNLNFREKIVIFRTTGLGPLCGADRIDAWLMDFSELFIPGMIDFNHF